MKFYATRSKKVPKGQAAFAHSSIFIKLVIYTIFSTKFSIFSWLVLIREKSSLREEETLRFSRKHLLIMPEILVQGW